MQWPTLKAVRDRHRSLATAAASLRREQEPHDIGLSRARGDKVDADDREKSHGIRRADQDHGGYQRSVGSLASPLNEDDNPAAESETS
jgi:hypothetical protein